MSYLPAVRTSGYLPHAQTRSSRLLWERVTAWLAALSAGVCCCAFRETVLCGAGAGRTAALRERILPAYPAGCCAPCALLCRLRFLLLAALVPRLSPYLAISPPVARHISRMPNASKRRTFVLPAATAYRAGLPLVAFSRISRRCRGRTGGGKTRHRRRAFSCAAVTFSFSSTA